MRDTIKLLRLIDQDRRGSSESARRRPRRDLQAPENSPFTLSYGLKAVAGQILGIRMVSFPGERERGSRGMDLVPYEEHAMYLASDLVGTC